MHVIFGQPRHSGSSKKSSDSGGEQS